MDEPDIDPMLQERIDDGEPAWRRRLSTLVLLICLLIVVAVAATAAGIVQRSGKNGDISQDEWEEHYIRGPDVWNIQFSITYSCELSGEVSHFELVSTIPRTVDRRQEVCYSCDPQPVEVFDEGETRYARFVFKNPTEGLRITISGSAAIHRYDLVTAKMMGRPAEATSLDRYLVDEEFLEKDSYKVEQIAEEIEGENDLEVVENIFRLIIDEFSYREITSGYGGAEDALRRGGGRCVDYADAMVALCRAKEIPARTAYGIIVDESMQDEEFLEHLHMWVEVYLQEYGWVPFDPTIGEFGMDFFDKLYPDYFRFSDVRNDLNLGLDIFFNYYVKGDPVEVKWYCDISFSEP